MKNKIKISLIISICLLCLVGCNKENDRYDLDISTNIDNIKYSIEDQEDRTTMSSVLDLNSMREYSENDNISSELNYFNYIILRDSLKSTDAYSSYAIARPLISLLPFISNEETLMDFNYILNIRDDSKIPFTERNIGFKECMDSRSFKMTSSIFVSDKNDFNLEEFNTNNLFDTKIYKVKNKEDILSYENDIPEYFLSDSDCLDIYSTFDMDIDLSKTFKPNYIVKDTFNGSKNQQEITYMISKNKYYRYLEENSIVVLEVPLESGKEVIDFIIPNYSSVDKEVVSSNIIESFYCYDDLNLTNLFEKLDKVNDRKCGFVKLPIFKIENSFTNIKDTLKSWTMDSMFKESSNFDSLGENLKVSNIITKTNLSIKDVEINTTEKIDDVLDTNISFIVDEPFMFFIRDTETGTVISSGIVSNIN